MVEVAQISRDNIEIKEHLVTVIPGWAVLHQQIIQEIVNGIHANPLFYNHLVQQFTGETEIFGTPVNTWRGLHLVCRRIEAQELAHLVDEEVQADDPGGCEEYIHTGGRAPVEREEDLLHTPARSTVSLSDSLHESIRTNIMYQNSEGGTPLPLHITAAEDIDNEHYIAYD